MSRFERLDSGAVAPPGGAAGGDLGGTYPAPRVQAITEDNGTGDQLLIGAVADGEALVRSGLTLVGQTIPTLTATPPVNVTKAPAAVGVALTAARADHKHDVTTAAPGGLAAGQAGAEGASTALARADHAHAVPTAAPVNVDKSAAAEGVSTSFARADHKHDVETGFGTSIVPGGPSAEGTSNKLSRSDHKHSLPPYGSSVGTIAQGNDARFPATDEKAALAGTSGSPSGVNRYVTDADPRLDDDRIPTGPAGGQLGGTYPNPDVRGLRETNGPQLLSMGGVADGQVLTRSGTQIIGTTPPGTGTVTGPMTTTPNRMAVWSDVLGTVLKEPNAPVDVNGQAITNVGTVDGRDVSVDGAKLDTIDPSLIPSTTQKAALAGTDGVPSGINRYVTNSDPRNTDSRIPTGSAGGQLGGTYPNPDVRGIRETGGPTPLSIGAIADGELLARSGASVVGAFRPNLTSTAPANVTKAAAVVGVSTEAARADHKHDISTAAAVGLSVGAANGEGSNTTLSRSDHIHALPAPPAPANVTKAAASAGSSGLVARADHKHDIDTAVPTPILIGDAQAEGTSTSLARADHVHAVTAPAAPVNVTKAAADAGASTSPARADHKHDVTTAAAVAIGTDTVNGEGSATSLARSDHTHEVNVPSSSVEENTDTTTTSATDVQIGALTLTPAAGTYLAMFGFSGERSNGGTWFFSLYQNAGIITNSERTVSLGAGLNSSHSTTAVVTMNGTDTISARWRTSGGTLTAHQRSLRLIRLS